MDLTEHWNYLYKHFLPSLAKAKDPVQNQWPIQLDHCFARVILDNAVGKDKPWIEVLTPPAYKNMSEAQLKDSIALAERIANGSEPDLLVELDHTSLHLRGKSIKIEKPLSRKRQADDNPRPDADEKATKSPSNKKFKKSPPSASASISKYFLPSPNSPPATRHASSQPLEEDVSPAAPTTSFLDQTPPEAATQPPLDPTTYLPRIRSATNLTPFRKLALTLLCQIPRGHYSTYAAMSDHITATCHKTCARAVGNAMKNNPFAPGVPCHRILAANGTIGGFKGGWGEEGKYAGLKRELLAEEGVRFDSRGKVKGPVWRGFWEVDRF